MFSWIKQLFVTKPKSVQVGVYYHIKARGLQIATASSREEAEQLIRDMFAEVDIKRRNDKGTWNSANISSATRYKAFRTNFKVVKYCSFCGLTGQGCGQC